MEKLTFTQYNVLRFIKAHANKNGFPPTRAEIAKHFGWASVNGAQQHLIYIQKKGHIKIIPGISRGIRFL